ncbi:MAG: hypothetical protein WAL40_03155, partial [Rhodoplanes sp.]
HGRERGNRRASSCFIDPFGDFNVPTTKNIGRRGSDRRFSAFIYILRRKIRGGKLAPLNLAIIIGPTPC